MKGTLILLAIGWAGLWCLCGPFWVLWLHRRVRSLRGSLTEAYDLSVQWPLNMTEDFKQGFLAAISAYRTAIKKLRDDK
jgi:hypothetical protein